MHCELKVGFGRAGSVAEVGGAGRRTISLSLPTLLKMSHQTATERAADPDQIRHCKVLSTARQDRRQRQIGGGKNDLSERLVLEAEE